MKPLGKAMKYSQFQNQGEKGTLYLYLVNYHDTLQQVFLLLKRFFEMDSGVTYTQIDILSGNK